MHHFLLSYAVKTEISISLIPSLLTKQILFASSQFQCGTFWVCGDFVEHKWMEISEIGESTALATIFNVKIRLCVFPVIFSNQPAVASMINIYRTSTFEATAALFVWKNLVVHVDSCAVPKSPGGPHTQLGSWKIDNSELCVHWGWLLTPWFCWPFLSSPQVGSVKAKEDVPSWSANLPHLEQHSHSSREIEINLHSRLTEGRKEW